jgi:hypothetical protein
LAKGDIFPFNSSLLNVPRPAFPQKVCHHHTQMPLGGPPKRDAIATWTAYQKLGYVADQNPDVKKTKNGKISLNPGQGFFLNIILPLVYYIPLI